MKISATHCYILDFNLISDPSSTLITFHDENCEEVSLHNERNEQLWSRTICRKNKIVERIRRHAAAYITQNQDVLQFQMIFFMPDHSVRCRFLRMMISSNRITCAVALNSYFHFWKSTVDFFLYYVMK